MLTPFGKAVRKLRIDRGWLLRDMAAGISVAPSFLSSIETGKKPLPADVVDRITRWGRLSDEEELELNSAFAASVSEFKIKASSRMSSADREAAALLARTFGSLPSEDIAKIREIILRRRA